MPHYGSAQRGRKPLVDVMRHLGGCGGRTAPAVVVVAAGVAAAWEGQVLKVPVTRNSLASRPTSVREARDRLTAFLGSWGNQVARDNATLLLSEVTTNAVRHARGGTIQITLTLAQGQLVAQVHDESANLPVRRAAGEGGGWGLELIDMLSNRSGVDQHPGDGKTVWFEIDEADPKDRPPRLVRSRSGRAHR